MQDKKYDIVLAIAGSDSGGGAGIQADIKTISACGCYAATAITAVTVQNTLGVVAVEAITPQTLAAQIDAVLSDIGADAIKIGMLHSSETIIHVKAELEKASIRNIVLDPVMVATSGHRLIEESAIETLKTELIPMARVITPNIPEAEILLGKSISEQAQMGVAARELAEMYNVSVLLKAGHLNEDRLVDYLYDLESETLLPLESKRLNTNNTHGTGCTLSSALASFLARGFSLPESATRAKKYIEQAIIAGAEYKIGNGHGPVKHFWELWR
ncbi:MAG: bifunctional hydroxymethylpyrimidine kinase/phosphomethylpyrimidine kinase [bacterium]